MTINQRRKGILRVNRQNDLYVYQFYPQARPTALASFSSKLTELAHRRMGHLNHQTLRLMPHLSTGMMLGNKPKLQCPVCMESKSTRTPYPKSNSHARVIGELTHADICYVGIPIILGRCLMFLLLIDDKTRFTHIYLLIHKNDAIH